MPPHVRFGSKADEQTGLNRVRFTPPSGLLPPRLSCPLWVDSRPSVWRASLSGGGISLKPPGLVAARRPAMETIVDERPGLLRASGAQTGYDQGVLVHFALCMAAADAHD